MTPTVFKGQNVVFGEGQPEYLPLPALKLSDDTGTVITCWELTDEEIKEVIKNKKVYVSMFTFNQPLTPISLQVSIDKFFDITKEEGKQ